MGFTPLKKTLSDVNKQLETGLSMRGVPLSKERMDELREKKEELLATQEEEREQRLYQSEQADRVIRAVAEGGAAGVEKTCSAVAEGTQIVCSAVAETKDEVVGTRGDVNKGFTMVMDFLRANFLARKPRASSSSKTEEEKKKDKEEKKQAAKKKTQDKAAGKEKKKAERDAKRKADKEEADRLKREAAAANQKVKDFYANKRKKARTDEPSAETPVRPAEVAESGEPAPEAEETAAGAETGEQETNNQSPSPPAENIAEHPAGSDEATASTDAPSGRSRFHFLGLTSKH